MSDTSAGKIALLAMPSSGESFFARDEWGDIWLHRPVLEYEPTRASPDDVAAAVTRLDWNVVDKEFDKWGELDAARLHLIDSLQQLTPDPPDFAHYGRRDVELAVEEAGLIDHGNISDAVDLLLSLLSACPVVQSEPDLLDLVAGALRGIVAPVSDESAGGEGEIARALNRMTLPAAA